MAVFVCAFVFVLVFVKVYSGSLNGRVEWIWGDHDQAMSGPPVRTPRSESSVQVFSAHKYFPHPTPPNALYRATFYVFSILSGAALDPDFPQENKERALQGISSGK